MGSRLAGHVLGVISVIPGRRYESELTAWDEEEYACWEILRFGDDVYSVRVVAAAPLDLPVPLVTARPGADAGYQAGRDFQAPSRPCLNQVLAGTSRGRNVADVVSGWAGGADLSPTSIWLTFQPLPLALPVVLGHWRRLMYAAASTRTCPRLFAQWPPADFFRQRQRQHVGPSRPVPEDAAELEGRLWDCIRDLRSWAPAVRELDQQGFHEGAELSLRSHVSLLESVAWNVAGHASMDGPSGSGPAQLVQLVRLGRMIKRSDELELVLRRAVSIVCPAFAVQHVTRALSERPPPLSKTHLQRITQAFDYALALHAREVFATTAALPWYGFCDSSPQGGHDWLLSYSHALTAGSASDLLRLAQSVNELARGTADVAKAIANGGRGSSSSTGGEGLEAEGRGADSPAALTRQICEGFSQHTFVPGALGARAGSLVDKVGTFLHGARVETSSLELLRARLQSLVSWTTDLGTEAGFSDVSAAGFWPALRATFGDVAAAPQAVEADTGEAAIVEATVDAGAAAADWDAEAHLFMVALPIPGMCHLMDNLSHDLHTQCLRLWPSFAPLLQAVCDLLCALGPLEAFIHRCLRLPGYTAYVPHFEKTFVRHRPHRWGSLMEVLDWMMPLRDMLTTAWDPQRFGANDRGRQQQRDGDGAGGPCDVDRVTEAIRSPWFWVFGGMCQALQSVVERVTRWSEECPCHRLPFIAGETAAQRQPSS